MNNSAESPMRVLPTWMIRSSITSPAKSVVGTEKLNGTTREVKSCMQKDGSTLAKEVDVGDENVCIPSEVDGGQRRAHELSDDEVEHEEQGDSTAPVRGSEEGSERGGTSPQDGNTGGGASPQDGNARGGASPQDGSNRGVSPQDGSNRGVSPQDGNDRGGALPQDGSTTGEASPQDGSTTGGASPQDGSTTGASPQDGSTAHVQRISWKRLCRYGAQCYRKNPEHKKQFCHPGDADFDATLSSLPVCPYGAVCYRKNKAHWQTHSHPPNTPFTRPGKKTRKPEQRENDSDDDYDSADSFLNDASSDDYQPTDTDDSSDSDVASAEDDGSEPDAKRTKKEAKQFLRKKK